MSASAVSSEDQFSRPQSSPLRIQLFGHFGVWLDGRPIAHLRTRKGQWLLSLLALRKGREVDRAWLAGILWPDSPQAQAYGSLRRALTDVRQVLGTHAGRIQSPGPSSLKLETEAAWVDTAAFDDAIRRGDLASLEEAVSLYSGPVLEECTEPWVLQEREPREQAFLAALETLATQALTAGDAATAEAHLRRAVLGDPLRETAQRMLMEALARQGDNAAAILVYRELRLLLRQELNLDPDPETTALYNRLRAEAETKASSKPATIRPAPVEAPPVRRLPRPLTEFVGRRREVQSLRDLLDQRRLITLTGPGGIGKTRLALQVAAEIAERLAEGVVFVDLAPLEDPALVVQATAAAIGAKELMGQSLVDSITDMLQSRRALLILDNCEHLLGACAQLSERLLSGAPKLRMLATSRQALGVTGETDWRVPPLSLPSANSSLEEERGSEAVQLFVQRAQAARPDFALTPGNAQAVAQVCRRLDGIPLALELAAARLKLLTAEQIAARLDQRFQLLTAGSTTALPRQRTLRATLDWSYELLPEPERVLLRRLSVFPSRFSLETAEAVCGEGVQAFRRSGVQDSGSGGPNSEVRGPAPGPSPLTSHLSPESPPLPLSPSPPLPSTLDLLGQLVDKSLLAVEEQDGEAVYRLLETTRVYGREQLRAAGEEQAVRARHAAQYLALAEKAGPKLVTSGAAEWLDRLEAVHDDLRAAMGWFTESASETAREDGLRMVTALWQFWRIRNAWGRVMGWFDEPSWREIARWLEALLAPSPPASRAGARGLRQLGYLYRGYHLRDQARSVLEQSLAISEQLDDPTGAAAALSQMAALRAQEGNADEAMRLYHRSLELRREAGDREGIAESLTGLAGVEYRAGRYAAARPLHEEALAIQREIGDPLGISAALTSLGGTYYALGDHRAAREAHSESLAINQRLKHTVGIAWSLDNIAEAELALGDVSTARELYRRSAAMFLEMRHRNGAADCCVGMAEIALQHGGQAVRAARLLAASQVLRNASQITLTGANRTRFERLLEAVRSSLDETEFSEAWSAGESLTMDPAVEYALSETN